MEGVIMLTSYRWRIHIFVNTVDILTHRPGCPADSGFGPGSGSGSAGWSRWSRTRSPGCPLPAAPLPRCPGTLESASSARTPPHSWLFGFVAFLLTIFKQIFHKMLLFQKIMNNGGRVWMRKWQNTGGEREIESLDCGCVPFVFSSLLPH